MVGRGFVIGRSRVRPPVYGLPRNNLEQVVYMHVPLSTKQYKLVPASAGIGRRCSWWPTGATPASLIPVVAVVFICGLSDVLINEYLFIIYLYIFGSG